MIHITHHGAINGVTGSCHELVVGSSGILVDCGLFQGADQVNGASASDLEVRFPIDHIRALVVTHVHIDHVGRIPYLLAAGFEGPIICSEPSALMLPEILEDALRIGFTRNRQLIGRVLELIRSRLVPLPYNQWHTLFDQKAEGGQETLAVRLQRAGHILGSAYVECDAAVSQAGSRQEQRIVFSGDLGAPHSPLLREPESPERADCLVIESTYGDRDHEDRETRRHRLRKVLEHALEDGGTVLIPAFSIGRTQELLYEIEDIIHEHGDRPVFSSSDSKRSVRWADLEIVVDSPLAAEFTRIYRDLKPFWAAEALERVARGRHPLSFEQLTVIDSHEDHLRAVGYLAESGRPCVVIAGSGMCAGGRIVNYLKAMLGDARNDVLFIGYQAAGTPGRQILEEGPGGGWVVLDNASYQIRARVHQVGGYSAHAGQSDLLRFIEGIPKPPDEIRIVHGDRQARSVFRRLLTDRFQSRVLVPGE